MQPSRPAARISRHLRSRIQWQSRRYASDSKDHGSHAPTTESLGSGFYTAVAVIPFSLALYKFSAQGTDEEPYLTRLMTDTYNKYKVKWAERNDTHTRAVEQAAADRLLFLNETTQSVRHVDLRFPEQFNTGAPWNVPAGHGRANIDQLIAKYKKDLYEANEKKLQQLRENKVPVEQPYETFVKVTPGANDS